MRNKLVTFYSWIHRGRSSCRKRSISKLRSDVSEEKSMTARPPTKVLIGFFQNACQAIVSLLIFVWWVPLRHFRKIWCLVDICLHPYFKGQNLLCHEWRRRYDISYFSIEQNCRGQWHCQRFERLCSFKRTTLLIRKIYETWKTWMLCMAFLNNGCSLCISLRSQFIEDTLIRTHTFVYHNLRYDVHWFVVVPKRSRQF